MILNGGTIKKLAAHYVGNKSVDGELKLTNQEYEILNDEELSILNQHFLDPMKESNDLFRFHHDIDLNLHELNHLTKMIFEDNSSFQEHSKQLAQLLFNRSLHPKIIPGDFFVVLFDDCIVEGEVVQGLGLFKFENKQIYLKSGFKDDQFRLSIERGILQKKVDKAALIFDTDSHDGYNVILVDKKNQNTEAHFWVEEFLKVKPLASSYSYTQNYLNLTKQFVVHQTEENPERNKADEVELLNKSVNYFKTHEKFNEKNFVEEVLELNDSNHEAFRQFKDSYQIQQDLRLVADFDISDAAVKKNSKFFKKVIKLDKNFDVYIHGNGDLIERGVDPSSGKKYYKLYFDNES